MLKKRCLLLAAPLGGAGPGANVAGGTGGGINTVGGAGAGSGFFGGPDDKKHSDVTRKRTWKGKLLDSLGNTVNKYVPDPRRDPMADRPVGYEDFKDPKIRHAAQATMPESQTVDDYMKKRTEDWIKRNTEENYPTYDKELLAKRGLKQRTDGSIFTTTGIKKVDESVETQNQHLKDIIDKESTIDEEKLKLRRQLAVDDAETYRKFVAEMKRSDIQEQQSMRRRLPHPADPKYDPFKNTPGYRPQDSTKLASWLKRQRESGLSASGASLSTREGQERFYNEEKMATQSHANPFAHHVEVPRGLPKMTITHLSPDSICINDKEIIGSIIVTPTRYYHWNATTIEDINTKTMSLLLHLYPPPDVVFIGTGRNLYMVDEELRIAFMKRGTVIHCMTTREACSTFGLQLTHRSRVACALLSCVPTNPFGKECFGDFIDNDSYILSDTQLGIRPNRQFNPMLYRTNKVAEKYRDTLGSGYGPKYHQLSDGRLVRPGTAGTKLRPMIEPGEDIEWEKLPSYYHWFPKETLEDYFEKRTWRDVQGMPEGFSADRRMRKNMGQQSESSGSSPASNAVIMAGNSNAANATTGGLPEGVAAIDEQPKADLMPWDSNSIPMPKWPHEKNHTGDIVVEDPKTGRMLGMQKGTFEKWKKMMARRKELEQAEDRGEDVSALQQPEDEPVEFDQEDLVRDKSGRMMDFSKMKYIPMMENRWHAKKKHTTGRALPQ